MTRVRCIVDECVFWCEGFCGSEEIDMDPELGCLTLMEAELPGDEEEETIASGSTAAVAAGFTSVVCMPNTRPPIESEIDVEYIHRKGRQARKTHVYTMGAITKSREGVELAEMGLMTEAGAGSSAGGFAGTLSWLWALTGPAIHSALLSSTARD